MATLSVKSANVEAGERHASLHLSHGANGPVLTARVPPTFREEDFAPVAKSAFGLIHKLTGCNCLSGRISFVVEDNYADVIRTRLSMRVCEEGPGAGALSRELPCLATVLPSVCSTTRPAPT